MSQLCGAHVGGNLHFCSCVLEWCLSSIIPSRKLTYPLKIDRWKGDSYWKPSFLGAMLVLGRLITSS